jgi:putative tryptophan/tyrosine transport system substrate-binding protein
MRRREFIVLMGAIVAWPFAALAQEAGRTYGLGVLLPAARDVPVNAAFLDEFRRHGFFEGKNLSVEWRAYGPHPDLISQYAAELVEARVDVIAAAHLRRTASTSRSFPILPIRTSRTLASC